jgi:hypothetical protein
VTAPMRSDLGLDNYGSSVNTSELSLWQKLVGRLVSPLVPVLFKQIVRQMGKAEKAR